MVDVTDEAPRRNGEDPIAMTRDAVEKAHQLLLYSDPLQARLYFRRSLERIVAHMCPICGGTGDHEDPEHRFVAPVQKILDSRTIRA